jgi:predicted O-linked N-acetylglucosamine transferase (SPINDLY family)
MFGWGCFSSLRKRFWLFANNQTARNNLRSEAAKRGIDSERLVFAEYMQREDHLNRIQLADVFLDTFPCNAHTTASDALRVGLPLLTYSGESFASRVAASLLNAVGLPELIMSSLEEYKAFALELAINPQKLAQIKQKLLNNLPTAQLYDTPLFTRHIEAAYVEMYERYQNDLAPAHIYVAP